MSQPSPYSDEARVERAQQPDAARPYDASTLAQLRARRGNLVYDLTGPIARFLATVDQAEAERDKARALMEQFMDEASTARLDLSRAERESAGYRQFIDDARLKLGAALGCNLEYEQPDWPAIEDKIRGLRARLLHAEAERDEWRDRAGDLGRRLAQAELNVSRLADTVIRREAERDKARAQVEHLRDRIAAMTPVDGFVGRLAQFLGQHRRGMSPSELRVLARVSPVLGEILAHHRAAQHGDALRAAITRYLAARDAARPADEQAARDEIDRLLGSEGGR